MVYYNPRHSQEACLERRIEINTTIRRWAIGLFIVGYLVLSGMFR